MEAVWSVANPPYLSWLTSKAIVALERAREEGRVIIVPSEQIHVEALEAKPCNISTECVPDTKRVRIKLLDGENVGKEGWVSSRWLRQEESK